MVAQAARSASTVFRCYRCGAYLGRFVNGVLHEPNGNKSGCPVVRRCKCGRRNVALARNEPPPPAA